MHLFERSRHDHVFTQMDRLNYRLVVTYRQGYRKWSVRVLSPVDEAGLLPAADFFDWLDASKFENLLQEMKAWCEEHQTGTHMAYDEFMFKTKAEATMFVLRFQ